MKNPPKPQFIDIPLDDRHYWATVQVRESERKKLATAIPAVTYALHDAAAVFGMLEQGFASGTFNRQDAGIISLARICAAHFNALAENEGDTVAQLTGPLESPVRVVLAGEEP
jgi:hypothetical protein